MTDPEKESEKQKGLSKEAWTAISAIAVALIGGIFAVVNTLLDDRPPPHSSPSPPPSGSLNSPNPFSSPSPSGSGTLPSPSSVPSSIPTVVPPASAFAQKLAQDLDAVNIDFSDAKERDHLGNPFSKYPQFAEGCLKLLNNQRLKKKTYFDVIFWNYTEELGGQVTSDSPAGDLDTNILKAAMIRAYNTRNGTNVLSFGDIVEPKS
jgi:hypothetical protein